MNRLYRWLLVFLLDRVRWPVPTDVFDALVGAVPTAAIELVLFKKDDDGRMKVILFPRPPNDTKFRGQVHGAGTVVNGTDDSKESPLRRLLAKELDNKVLLEDLVFVEWDFFPKGEGPMQCRRGSEVDLLYYAVWKHKDIPEGALLVDPDNLPANIISFHPHLIRRALEAYESRN